MGTFHSDRHPPRWKIKVGSISQPERDSSAAAEVPSRSCLELPFSLSLRKDGVSQPGRQWPDPLIGLPTIPGHLFSVRGEARHEKGAWEPWQGIWRRRPLSRPSAAWLRGCRRSSPGPAAPVCPAPSVPKGAPQGGCPGWGGGGAPASPARNPKPAPLGENVSCVTAPRPGVSKQKSNTSGWRPVGDVKFTRRTGLEEKEEEPGGDRDPLGEPPGPGRGGAGGVSQWSSPPLRARLCSARCDGSGKAARARPRPRPRRPSRVRKRGLEVMMPRPALHQSAGKAN